MVQSCCVTTCCSRSHDRHGKKNEGVRFFSFPTWKQKQGPLIRELTKRRRIAWVAAVKRPNITFYAITRHMMVCSRHFLTGRPAYEMNETHPDWAPSLHLGHTDVKTANYDRYYRRMIRNGATPATIQAVEPEDGAARNTSQMPAVDGDPQQNCIVEIQQCASNNVFVLKGMFSLRSNCGNQKGNSSLDQEEPDSSQIKEEYEEPELGQIKEEHEEPDSSQIKEEYEEPELRQIKEEHEEPELRQIKEEPEELELPEIKVEHEGLGWIPTN
ncbi:uncharacterized protein LOC115383164 [Salarias fasciatus]|uniref:uncharacterized protein LOC115383164 n=1 Tax=Salarias fasciatus TaxID=181472 RepID=UPI0011769497|nr:uncharacterized protein LOC115383164 [Salarias fasciatus]